MAWSSWTVLWQCMGYSFTQSRCRIVRVTESPGLMPVTDLELMLLQVDVDGVLPVAGRVDECPPLGRPLLHLEARREVEALAVDGPAAVLVVEDERPLAGDLAPRDRRLLPQDGGDDARICDLGAH